MKRSSRVNSHCAQIISMLDRACVVLEFHMNGLGNELSYLPWFWNIKARNMMLVHKGVTSPTRWVLLLEQRRCKIGMESMCRPKNHISLVRLLLNNKLELMLLFIIVSSWSCRTCYFTWMCRNSMHLTGTISNRIITHFITSTLYSRSIRIEIHLSVSFSSK